MKLVLDKSEFVKALQMGGAFAGRSKNLPILDCVKVKAARGRCSIVSTDGENAINKSFDASEIVEEGTICVNFKDLMSYSKLIKDKTLTIETDDESKSVVIRHSKGRSEYPLSDEDTFPKMKGGEEYKEFRMEAALVNNWLVDSLRFVSHDDLRPAMTGVYFYYENGEFGYCASDGRKLVTDNIKTDMGGSRFEYIINQNSINPICNALQNASEVTIRVSENSTTFITEDVFIMSRNVEGHFPSFKMVIPKDNNIISSVSKDELLGAIERCKLSANAASSLIKLSIGNGNMVVESQDIDFAKKSVENVKCDSESDITIGFSATNLIDCLSSMNTESVAFKMKNESTAALMYEVDGDNDKVILLMPMMMV